MDQILTLIAKETEGRCYHSYKYSVDVKDMPSMNYEEIQEYKLQKDKYGETDTSLKTSKALSEKAKQIQTYSPLFRYFLDGSRRVYKVDDIELNRKNIFPVIAGQVGVACCERLSPSSFKKAALDFNLVISLPNEADKDGKNTEQFFNSIIQKINNLRRVRQFNLSFSKILPYSTKNVGPDDKLEDRGIAKIQDELIDSEKKTVSELVKRNLLNQDVYLLKDGSLQYKPMKSGDFRELSKIKSNYRCVVGVSKSFNPELSVDRYGRNATKIASLPLHHRTPAFMFQTPVVGYDIYFSIWYLRIREAKYCDSPFAGVIKIEKVLVTENEIENGLSSDEVDLISANIINESYPVAYGTDTRWANHLYPIYLTEKYVKSQHISDLHFLNLF